MPADAAGLSGNTYSTTKPSPLARPSCSLTTSGTCDVSTPRNVIGTFGDFWRRPGTPGGPSGPGVGGGTGGVCPNPAMGKAMAAIVALVFIFIFLLLLIHCSETGMRTTSSLGLETLIDALL